MVEGAGAGAEVLVTTASAAGGAGGARAKAASISAAVRPLRSRNARLASGVEAWTCWMKRRGRGYGHVFASVSSLLSARARGWCCRGDNGTCRRRRPEPRRLPRSKNSPWGATKTTLRWRPGPRGWLRAATAARRARTRRQRRRRKDEERCLPLPLLRLPPSRARLLLFGGRALYRFAVLRGY